jgi:hypothetical protein
VGGKDVTVRPAPVDDLGHCEEAILHT